ncbi:STN domain-containing protein [Caulobacter sp. CCNWLY153]|uniref:STN domain-containing protein n=1 Tax=unclassified Caulobacter TaxID=2648921 RepID=UPI002FEF3359
MSAALEAYAAVSGLQILYDRPPDSGLRSPGAKGRLTPQEALAKLLAGSGLEARFSAGGDVLLAPLGAGGPPAAVGPEPAKGPLLELDTLEVEATPIVASQAAVPPTWPLYGGVVQQAVRSALRADRRTALGDYSTVLRLWIAPSGRIVQTAPAISTGDADRDALLGQVLKNLLLPAPPPEGMPQPVTIRVQSSPLR